MKRVRRNCRQRISSERRKRKRNAAHYINFLRNDLLRVLKWRKYPKNTIKKIKRLVNTRCVWARAKIFIIFIFPHCKCSLEGGNPLNCSTFFIFHRFARMLFSYFNLFMPFMSPFLAQHSIIYNTTSRAPPT